MFNWLKEIIRRVSLIIFGTFLFDMPGLNFFRKIIVKWLVCNNKMGEKVMLSRHINFYVPHGLAKEKVALGNSVRISENVSIDCSGSFVAEDNVWISENTLILNHEHIIDGKTVKNSKQINKTEGLILEADCWVGANAVILPQVTRIGKGAIIGAGSVVTKNVEDWDIVAGNPANVIGKRG